ncbi:hypothetical protein [Streptomyces sp. CC208A]|uniref:hypothetical protein n=1 Tax=Streptomyces sp. CC208A TaxID=3044573 RepID=UPI0024A7DFD8|nr:hypothetical protein [Streptomyces sp. CC208A]
MGVIDSQWWSLRWPWMAVWLLTATCFAVVFQHVLARWAAGRRRRDRDGDMVSGMCVYLHETRVEDVADYLGIPKSDLNVSHETSVSSGLGLRSRLAFGEGSAQRDRNTHTRTEYWEPSTPMKTIRLIMDKLREKDRVVDADLATGQLVPTAALADKLQVTGDGGSVPLTSVRGHYVSVSGLFTVRRTDSGDVVLRARYGSGDPPAHVKITCEKSWVREEFRVDDYSADEEFPATCLGRVRTWNSTTGELTLDPVSIFR